MPHVGVGRADCVPHLVTRAVDAASDSAISVAPGPLERQLRNTERPQGTLANQRPDGARSRKKAKSQLRPPVSMENTKWT